ncbi:MAG: lytic transglycosylase domain-containing protein [Pseudomonadota bacterium]
MSEAVKNKTLVEHFSRYIDYKQASNATGASFTERLSRGVEEKSEKKRQAAAPRAGRRYQPPSRLGRAKSITSVQAQRLARYAPLIEGAAKKYGVPVELICGVMLQESGGNPRAVSPAGARGLMQLMPATARRFGVTNPFDPVQSIDGGTRYLSFLLNRFNGKLDLAIAGYNAGEGNVEKYGNKIPPFRETQGYVPNVLGYTQSMIDIFASRMGRFEIPSGARRV